MRGLTSVERQRRDMRRIAMMVARAHKISEADIYVRDRKPKFVQARVVLWKMLRAKGHTLQDIAGLAGWDHKTISHALREETRPPELPEGLACKKER